MCFIRGTLCKIAGSRSRALHPTANTHLHACGSYTARSKSTAAAAFKPHRKGAHLHAHGGAGLHAAAAGAGRQAGAGKACTWQTQASNSSSQMQGGSSRH